MEEPEIDYTYDPRTEKYLTLKPRIVKNIFTDQEYADLYEEINAMPESFITPVEDVGYFAYMDPVNSDLSDSLISKIEPILKTKIKKTAIHFARYTKATNSVPRLMPHYDENLTHASYTLSVILDSTLDWSVFVENDEFFPLKNQAVVFSGTHQIHYRPLIEFSDTDYYDILVCQFEEDIENPIYIDKVHRDNINARIGKYCSVYQIMYGEGDYRDPEWLKARLDEGWTGPQICEDQDINIEVVKHFIDLAGLNKIFFSKKENQ